MVRKHRVYNLYGFRLQSQMQLACPQGQMHVSRPDVELVEYSASDVRQACKLGGTLVEASDFYRLTRLLDGSIYLLWPGFFEFLISSDGSRIGWRNLDGTPREALQEYLLGQVLSFAMLARGVEPLHATAVVVGGGAVAFLGDSGYGKSSLGASFVRENYPLLTDDVLVLERRGQDLLAYPGMPRIKLFPEMCESMFQGCEGTPMNRWTHKTIFALSAQQHQVSAIPLRILYVLSSPSNQPRKVTLRRMSERKAFLSVLKNTFNDVMLSPRRLKRQFEFAASTAAHVPVKVLSYPRTLSAMPVVVKAVLSDLAQEGRSE
jgi:hypothetical protein